MHVNSLCVCDLCYNTVVSPEGLVPYYYVPTPTLLVSDRGVECPSPSVCLLVCLSVCLFVCPQHNSKMNDSKVFKLGIPRNDMVLGLKGQRSRLELGLGLGYSNTALVRNL